MSYPIFVDQLMEAENAFPKLKRKLVLDRFVLAGEVDIIDHNGKFWESYQIEIRYEEGFPHCFPSLYETGDKIPKIADWHIYEDTFACCVKIKPTEIIRCANGISITQYIEEEALPYLFNQTHRRVEGYYVNGEYAHGIAGLYQFYSEELGTGRDMEQTLRLMHFIATNPRPVRTSMCFCNSGIKVRNCHHPAFDKMKIIGEEIILQHHFAIGRTLGLF